MLEIQGQNIKEHPFKDNPFLDECKKIATVLAVSVLEGGVVYTPEGKMRFKAGDYIVTDNPPTHAWPVAREVFEKTYVRIPSDD